MDLLTRKLQDLRGNVLLDVAEETWNHWESAVLDPNTDRKSASTYMHRILDDYPDLQTRHKTRLLGNLDYAIATFPAHHSNIEAEIDSLVEQESKPIDATFPDFGSVQDSSPAAHSLFLSGFQAVPALLAHIHDERLTRCMMQGMDRYPMHIATVKEIVSALLQNLAGKRNIVEHNYTTGESLANGALAAAWWKRASSESEEQYLVNNVLPEKDEDKLTPFEPNAELVAAKYPDRLPEIYARLTCEYPHSDSSRMSSLVAQMKSRSAVVEPLLVKAATTGGSSRRVGALYALLTIHHSGTADLVAYLLDNLPPKEADDPGFGQAYPMADLVMRTDEQKAWDALVRLARRSALSQRLEILGRFEHTSWDRGQNIHEIQFLTTFLDDETVCDFTKGELIELAYLAHMGRGRITVSDIALSYIGNRIGVPSSRADRWTNEEWDEWKRKAQVALKKFIDTGNTSLPQDSK